jgi:hypothetical protein
MDESSVVLSEVLAYLQSDLVPINPSPGNQAHLVSDVLLLDPLDTETPWTNRIVLALGIAPGTPEFDLVLERSKSGDAAAVVVKAHGAALNDIGRTTQVHPVALLIAEDDADWTRLGALIRSSVLGAEADSVSGVRLGDVYALANAIASLTNGATSVVDPVGRILGYSTLPGQPIDNLRRATTLALQELIPPAHDPDFKTVYASDTAVRIPDRTGDLDRLAIAVRAGGELLGTIWTIDPGGDRHDQVLRTLDRLAPLAGLHLLHARSGADFGERRNGDLMRTILEDPSHAPFAAAQLGLDVTQGVAVAVFSLGRPDRESLEAVREMQRLLHLVTISCDLHFSVGHSALIDSYVYALFPSLGADPRSTHRRIAAEIAANARSLTAHPVICAVGRTATSVSELPRSRSEAVQSIHHLATRRMNADHEPGIALFEDFQARLGLNAVGAFIREHALDDNEDLKRIHEYDRNQRTDYLSTLREYLASNANIGAVAAKLHIHNNTARYRISRLTEQFGIVLDDPDALVWLQLRLSTFADTDQSRRARQEAHATEE